MNELTDPRQQSLAGKLKWALGIAAVLAGGALAGLYIASLVMIATAGALTLTVIHAAPWLSQKLAHFFLDLRKQDARENPITNRQRIAEVNWSKLSERKAQIESMGAEVRLWEGQIKALPDDEATEFMADLAAAHAEVSKQALAWKEAEAAQKAFDKVTERVARKWAVAQTGLRIKKLSQQDKEDRINTILANESAESADRALAQAFSSLDTIVQQAQSCRLGLEHNPSPTVNLVKTSQEVYEPVGIQPSRPWPRN